MYSFNPQGPGPFAQLGGIIAPQIISACSGSQLCMGQGAYTDQKLVHGAKFSTRTQN